QPHLEELPFVIHLHDLHKGLHLAVIPPLIDDHGELHHHDEHEGPGKALAAPRAVFSPVIAALDLFVGLLDAPPFVILDGREGLAIDGAGLRGEGLAHRSCSPVVAAPGIQRNIVLTRSDTSGLCAATRSLTAFSAAGSCCMSCSRTCKHASAVPKVW